MANNAKFSDRNTLIIPKDGQDKPADNDVAVQNLADASEYNWGDAIQENWMSTVDDGLVDSGTLSGRPAAGADAPKFYVVTDGGSGDQPYLTYNDDAVWHHTTELVEWLTIDDTDSPYAASEGESVWVDASAGTVTVNLPAPANGLSLRVVVIDATNSVTISRNGTESIDGSASDKTIQNQRALALESDGTNWRTSMDSRLDVADLAGNGLEDDGTNTLQVDIGSGLQFMNEVLWVEPTGIAGAFLSDDGSDNLQVNLGEGLEGDGADNIKVKEPFAYDPGMTEFPDALSNEEIDRIVLQSGETLVVERIEFRQKGGGSSTSASIDVRDTTVATTVGSQTLGGTTKDPGSSGSGNTVIVRVSNSTGATVNGAPRVHGYIEGA